MTFNELLAEVYLLTNRPDLTGITTSAVRSATLSLHSLDYYYRDLVEVGLVFTTPEYLQQIDYRVVLPSFRSLKYIRRTDSQGTALGDLFDVIVPEQVLDQYKYTKTNVCYVAGQIIQIRSSCPVQYILLGYYAHPNVNSATYSSWIAVDHPWAIVYKAAETVFKTIGDTEQFAAYTRLAAEKQAEIAISNIQANGY